MGTGTGTGTGTNLGEDREDEEDDGDEEWSLSQQLPALLVITMGSPFLPPIRFIANCWLIEFEQGQSEVSLVIITSPSTIVLVDPSVEDLDKLDPEDVDLLVTIGIEKACKQSKRKTMKLKKSLEGLKMIDRDNAILWRVTDELYL